MNVAVLGAGNSGQAQAADLALAGHDVALYNRLQDAQLYLDPIKKKDGLKITGEAREGFAKLKKVTSNIEEAVSDADIIFIATPAFAHDSGFLESAPYLKKGQVVMLIQATVAASDWPIWRGA